MKKIILSIIFLCSAFNGLCQIKTLNEPWKKISHDISVSKPDTNKVKLLLNFSKTVLLSSGAKEKEIDSAYRLMRAAVRLSYKLNSRKFLANCKVMAALINNQKGNKEKGFELAKDALKTFEQLHDINNQAEANIIVGQHFENSGADLEQKINYYKKAITLFSSINKKERAGVTLTDLGELLYLQDNYKESNQMLDSALNLYQVIGYKNLQGLYNLKSLDSYLLHNFGNAFKYALLAVKTAHAVKDTSIQLSVLYIRLAFIYMVAGKIDQAMVCYNKSLVVSQKYQDADTYAEAMLGMCYVFRDTNKPLKAINTLKDLLAYLQQKKASSLLSNNMQVPGLFLLCYINLKQYKNASAYIPQIEALMNVNPVTLRTSALSYIAKYYIATKNWKRAYPYLKQADSFGNKLSPRQVAQQEILWFKADSALGNYQTAIRHYQAYKKATDRDLSQITDRQNAFLEIEFETQEKNKDLLLQAQKIQLLNNQSQLQVQQNKSARILFIVVLSMLFVLLVLGFSRYRSKQLTNQQLQQKQKEINKQNATLTELVIEKEDLLSYQNTLITDKDLLLTEKDWLLKEIHHRVKNNLQIIMSILNAQSGFLKDKAALSAIKESQDRVQAIAMVHHKLYSNSNFAAIDMVGYINDFTYHLQSGYNTDKKNIRIEKNVADLSLDVSQAVPLGLIINEAITNCIKYAFTGRDSGLISVILSHEDDDTIQLLISDNGVGLCEAFDAENTTTMGTKMMKALTRQLKGTFSIIQNNGVSVKIRFEKEKKPIDEHMAMQKK